PHVAQNDSLTKTGKRRRSAIDARTTRHIGYQISQTCRKMAECIFGWGKQHGTMRKTKHRGIAAVAADFMPLRTRQRTRVNGPASTHAPSCRRRARLRLGGESAKQSTKDIAAAAPDLIRNGQCLAANGVLAPRDWDIRDFAVVAFQDGDQSPVAAVN